MFDWGETPESMRIGSIIPMGRWFLCFLAVAATLLQSSAWAYVRSAPQGALCQNTTYPVAENKFALESPIGLLCANDPVNKYDANGLLPEDQRAAVTDQNDLIMAFIRSAGGTPWTPGQVFNDKLKTTPVGNH